MNHFRFRSHGEHISATEVYPVSHTILMSGCPMKKSLVVLLASLMLGAASAPVSLVQNEYDFAAAVAKQGIRDGFLQYLDKQAIGFDPTPKNAYDTYSAAKPGSSASKLTWYPSWALLGSSGDFGVDTGPWTATWVKDGKPGKSQGEWLTVWMRNKDGEWKVLFDSGSGHPVPEHPARALEKGAAVPELPALAGPAPSTDDVQNQLVQAEKVFSNEAGDHGLRAAYQSSGAPDLRLLLQGSQPILGLAPVTRLTPDTASGLQWVPMGGTADHPGDLGYIYGTTYKTADTKHSKPQSAYMHVWRRDADGWKMLIALDSPL
jgi:ketosteroid isomerase-like protein